MALPSVQMGVPYLLAFDAQFMETSSQTAKVGKNTLHTMLYNPDSHAIRGTPIVPVDGRKEATIKTSAARTASGNVAELSFVNTAGEEMHFSGTMLPNRNEYVLLFDGTSFTIRPVTSSAGSMKEAKRATDRKRASPSEATSEAPEAKRSKSASGAQQLSSEHLPSPGSTSSSDLHSAPSSSSSAATINFSLAKPKGPVSQHSTLSAPITPVSAVVKETTADKPLTKSTEMRARSAALLDEPDSDDSDDSD